MTPKEKAMELLYKFQDQLFNEDELEAKQCALICVDEILDYIKRINDYSQMEVLSNKDWQEVKQELLKK